MGGTSAWFYKGNFAKQLDAITRSMNKIATKQALGPLADSLAQAALGLSVVRATKLAPASTMYAKSNPKQFRVGTTQRGAAAHQFGATIYPKDHAVAAELSRRLAMKAARMALANLGAAGGKTREARQFVRQAGRVAKLTKLAEAIVGYLTFQVDGRWVRVHKVKLPKREIFPTKLPDEWDRRFQDVTQSFLAKFFSAGSPDRNLVSGALRSKR